MNWIATNIRFPEDQYMKLKMKAAKERKSVAAVIREATNNTAEERNPSQEESEQDREKRVKEFMKDVEKIAKGNSKYVPKGFDSVKALREIRYGEE